LWEFDENSFIPHQIVGDGDDDAITAVLIVPPDATTPDRVLVINLRDECAPGLFDRVLEVVPADEDQRLGSRERWKTYKQAGFDVAKHDM
jgi:DNA polymerase-3 subunit chi